VNMMEGDKGSKPTGARVSIWNTQSQMQRDYAHVLPRMLWATRKGKPT